MNFSPTNEFLFVETAMLSNKIVLTNGAGSNTKCSSIFNTSNDFRPTFKKNLVIQQLNFYKSKTS